MKLIDQKLISIIQNGLPLVERPYEQIGLEIGLSETEVMERIQSLKKQGLIKRFGVIVRHRELGYHSNAMVVWDIPDNSVRQVAQSMTQHGFITLCYRRPRKLPVWPYNLFCMIHGKDRETVLQHLESMIEDHHWQNFPHKVLFSKRRFKQRGARYIQKTDPEKLAIAV